MTVSVSYKPSSLSYLELFQLMAVARYPRSSRPVASWIIRESLCIALFGGFLARLRGSSPIQGFRQSAWRCWSFQPCYSPGLPISSPDSDRRTGPIGRPTPVSSNCRRRASPSGTATRNGGRVGSQALRSRWHPAASSSPAARRQSFVYRDSHSLHPRRRTSSSASDDSFRVSPRARQRVRSRGNGREAAIRKSARRADVIASRSCSIQGAMT